jgi:hypothetical protein
MSTTIASISQSEAHPPSKSRTLRFEQAPPFQESVKQIRLSNSPFGLAIKTIAGDFVAFATEKSYAQRAATPSPVAKTFPQRALQKVLPQ